MSRRSGRPSLRYLLLPSACATHSAGDPDRRGPRRSPRDSLGEDATLGRTDLVVELPQERKSEQAIDADAFRKVVDVDPEVVAREAQRCEARNAHHVAALCADRRMDDGDLFAVAR